MSAYIKRLVAAVAAQQAKDELARAEQARAVTTAARERLTPLEERLARLLASIPPSVLAEGLSLTSLQTSLRGRWRGDCHPGELGTALRRRGYRRERRW